MNIILVSSHSITKRDDNDEMEDFNFESGIPHYPHAHYTNDGEIDFMPSESFVCFKAIKNQ